MVDAMLTEDWDLSADASGSIALCNEDYAIAQRVANEIKLFEGEGWYDRTQGTPHFARVLGKNTSTALIKNILIGRAENVDRVIKVDIDLFIDDKRVLHGDIFIQTDDGDISHASF